MLNQATPAPGSACVCPPAAAMGAAGAGSPAAAGDGSPAAAMGGTTPGSPAAAGTGATNPAIDIAKKATLAKEAANDAKTKAKEDEAEKKKVDDVTA